MGATASPRATARNAAGLPRKLAEVLQGEARFDAFTRGRYATDASIYQIMPAGVVFPKSADDIAATLKVAADHALRSHGDDRRKLQAHDFESS